MRSLIGASGARCNSRAQATASAARRERDDEAVALTLLDGPHTVMGGDRVGQCLVEARDGGFIASGWVSHNRVDPSTSASSNVTVPVGSSLMSVNTVAPARFAHASQHAVTRDGNHQRNR